MDSSEDGECSSNVDDICAVGPIRKRRFSNARIQPVKKKCKNLFIFLYKLDKN